MPRSYDKASENAYLEALVNVFPETSLRQSGLKPVVVIQKYKVLYNRVRKNASSSSMVLWNKLLTGQSKSVRRSNHNMTLIVDLKLKQLGELRDYRRLLVTRNPYTRVLSAFLDKAKRPHVQKLLGGMESTPDGFGQFVEWIGNGGLGANPHWDLQIHETLFPFSYYTDVIRFENFESAFPPFLESVGVPREKLPQDNADRGQNHRTGATEIMHQFYDKSRFDMVAKIYKADFEAFGYDPDISP